MFVSLIYSVAEAGHLNAAQEDVELLVNDTTESHHLELKPVIDHYDYPRRPTSQIQAKERL